MESGIYIVATPIGNLGDITLRAIETLKQADLIAAEDTRHTRRLLDALDISNDMISLHEHNEFERSETLISEALSGRSIALVSDAGTPLISDPGAHLVRFAREKGVKVVPVPGPSAVITAMSAAGLDTRRFVFEGFLPPKKQARDQMLAGVAEETRTLVFYESPHRIMATMASLNELFPERTVVLARELTKTFETFLTGRPAQLIELMEHDANQLKGEFVVLLEGCPEDSLKGLGVEVDETLRLLLAELPVKKAAGIAAKLTGMRKNDLYQRALELKEG